MHAAKNKTATLRQALAAMGRHRAQVWTHAKLEAAVLAEFGDASGWRRAIVGRLAINWLEADGLTVPQPRRERFHPPEWRLTPKGKQAITAELGRLKIEGRRAIRHAEYADPQSLQMRLWKLLSIRRVLTAKDAAEALIDAGDDEQVVIATRAAQQLFRVWNRKAPTVVAVAAQKVDNHKRYVLMVDGRYPPNVEGVR